MNPEDDMPMPMSDGAKGSDEKPDTEPLKDKETTLNIKGTFNDALRVLVGKKPRKSPSV